MQAHATTLDLCSPRDPETHHSTHGRTTGRSCPTLLRSGIAALFVCGVFAASSAQASDEFRQGFENQLGRSLARQVVHAVFDVNRPHTVRYVPSFYFDEHVRHGHGRHHYEPNHYRAASRHHEKHALKRGCGHSKARHHDRHDHRAKGHRDRYVKHDRSHGGGHDPHGDGRRSGHRDWDRHS